jgi:hypothetical protein
MTLRLVVYLMPINAAKMLTQESQKIPRSDWLRSPKMVGGSDMRLALNTFAQHIVCRLGGRRNLGIYAKLGEAVRLKLL